MTNIKVLERKWPSTKKLMILEAYQGGPALTAGIKSGDEIISVKWRQYRRQKNRRSECHPTRYPNGY
ncbi:MAG: hypothetical protein IPO48_00205 [Saprospiraceae bacterium]|nr:hypothetical protein [Saprospiraceae bacterium]